jgi:hypothetical protein
MSEDKSVMGAALVDKILRLKPDASVLLVKCDSPPCLLGKHFDYIVIEGEPSENLMRSLRSRLRDKRTSRILSSSEQLAV